MAIVNKPDMNYGVWAEGGNIEIPSSEKVEQGWIIEKPLNETMNWLQNRQDRMLQYINQRGIPEWDIRTDYPIGSFVAYAGTIYQAVTLNKDKNPTLNSDIWIIAFVTYSDFEEYADKVDKAENEDGYLSFYVKKSAPVLNAATKGVAYYNKTVNSGLAFSGNTPVIKNNNTNVAEFSGGTNPKDVVTHEQLNLAIQAFKVGSVYTTTVNENPRDTFGYGTWQRFGEGRTLVGFSTSVSNDIPESVKIAGSQYGKYKEDVIFPYNGWDVDGLKIETSREGVLVVGSGFREQEEELESLNQPRESQKQTLDNSQPSIVVYFWKRLT